MEEARRGKKAADLLSEAKGEGGEPRLSQGSLGGPEEGAAGGPPDAAGECNSVNSDACVQHHEHIRRMLKIESELIDVSGFLLL